ncbi:MAG: S6e family ribosomal protein [Candidatus Micrarchaeaceae archaeon]
MKFNYSDTKKGSTVSKELTDEEKAYLISKKIGDEVDGSPLGMPGYKFKITGGSDINGSPLEKSISNASKIKTLKKRQRKRDAHKVMRKTIVRGNTIAEDTALVNAKILQAPEGSEAQAVPAKQSET